MPINTEDYAIVIGIDNYSSLPLLSGARVDAAKFAEWLQDPDGGALLPENIRLILSSELSQSPSPVQDQIDDALESFNINDKARIGRRLYFYFSGHGYGQIDDIGMFMAPATLSRAVNIGLRPYKVFLSKWGFFDENVFILDCCRDPLYYSTTQQPSFTFPDTDIPDPPPLVENFVVLATDHGRQAFSAWDATSEQKRGILTKAVLEGLQGQLATDEKGRITASSLRDYVKGRVAQIAKQAGLDQKAEILRPSLGEIIFKEGIIKTQEIGVQIPAGVNELIIRNAKLKEIAQYTFDALSATWNFNYLTEDAQLQKFVQPGMALPANTSLLKVNLIQNGWYAFEVADRDMCTLDLREVDTNDTSYVFKFES